MVSSTKMQFLDQVNNLRLEASQRSSKLKKQRLSQYFTGEKLSRFMANFSMISCEHIKILDPGAGVGSLTAAVIEKLCRRKVRPSRISVVLFEIDSELIKYLNGTVKLCRERCEKAGIEFEYVIRNADFLENYIIANKIDQKFDLIIMNPPYKKITKKTKIFSYLESERIDTKNLYTAFLSIALRMMTEGAELIAIVPRSFCNGASFKSFRTELLKNVSFQRIHIFNSRKELFSEDDVLQENIVFKVVKTTIDRPKTVIITSSNGVEAEDAVKRNKVSYNFIVQPTDPDMYIRLPHDQNDIDNVKKMSILTHTLHDIGLCISTGKVVDFRTKKHLRIEESENTVPLIYPIDFQEGTINWNFNKKKRNLVELNSETKNILIPSKCYVVVKRFTSKEERKRVVCAVYDHRKSPNKYVGFENHLNYFHINQDGIEISLAKGLVLYLSSTHVDTYFRQFSGLTQVNARDLINLKYPSKGQLIKLGSFMGTGLPSQDQIDGYVEEICFRKNI